MPKKRAEPAIILPEGWIEKDEGIGKSLKKVYYNIETEQTFHERKDFERYIKYFMDKATHLHGTKPEWNGRISEGENPTGSNYVPEETKKFQSSTSMKKSRKTHEEFEDEDEDDDDYRDQDYTPRRKYKRSSCKRKGKNVMKPTEDEDNGDDHPMSAPPKRRQSKFPLPNRNARGNSSPVKAN